MSNVYVKGSKINNVGKGLFAGQDIKKGQQLSWAMING